MATPEAIGPYRVLRLLGQGGAGVVYEVADPMTGRSMALKLHSRLLPILTCAWS